MLNFAKNSILTISVYFKTIFGYFYRSVYASYNIEKIQFFDEIESVKQVAKELHDQGVQIIIATGHAGYEIDVKMAEEIEELDLVVGGHSHTFLFTGDEKPEGAIGKVL